MKELPNKQASKNFKAKRQRQEPAQGWRQVFRGAVIELSGRSWLQNFLIGLALLLIWPLIGATLMKSYRATIVGFGIGLSILVWIGVAILLHQAKDTDEPKPAVKQPNIVFGEGQPGNITLPNATPAVHANSQEPFAISVGGSMMSGRRALDSQWWLKSYSRQLREQILSPIHVVLDVRLTNKQSVKSMIETYAVEVQKPDGNWVKLIRIDSSDGIICIAGHDPKHARQIEITTLDSLLYGRSISPDETIEGATFFELPENVGIAEDAQPVLRVYVKDYGGATQTTVMSREQKWDFGQNWGFQVRDVIDLTSLKRFYYSERPK